MKERLDVFISKKYKISRSLSGNLIKKGLITINNQKILDKDFLTNNNDIIHILKQDLDIKVYYESENFSIIYKPKNISVCRTNNTPKVEKVLNEELSKIMSLSDAMKKHEFGLPHRLDKPTSGLMIITKTNEAYEKFINFFNKHLIKKKYLAFYENDSWLPKDLKFFICEHNYMNFSINNEDKCICNLDNTWKDVELQYIETHQKIILSIYNKDKTMKTFVKQHSNYFECIPITGERHQIRFTMNEIGFPIYGDNIYNRNVHKSDNMLLFSVFLGFPVF